MTGFSSHPSFAPQYCKDGDTGLFTPVIGHHGSPIIVDYQTAIGLGKIPGHTRFKATGRRAGLSTASIGDDIWNGVATSFSYPDQTVGEQLSVISTSANDTAAGTGVRKVKLQGLRVGGVVATEIITLNGNVAAVNSTITDWVFLQYLHTIEVTPGSIGVTALGNISCFRTGTPARVYGLIDIGTNISLSAHRMVPTGYTFNLNYLLASATAQKAVSVRLRATCDLEGILTPGIFIYNELVELEDSVVPLHLSMPSLFPPTCIIKATVYSTTSGGTAAVTFGGWLEFA